MSDPLYLSYWLRGFSPHNMLRHFEKLLLNFPFSTISPRGPLLRIYALAYTEPPLTERVFDWDAEVSSVIELAHEFENPDCAFLLDAYWDLWKHEGNWRLTPCPVTLICFGPEFENETGDHLRVEIQNEDDFLPRPAIPGSPSKIQSNIKGLLRLAHDLDDRLPVEQRKLWSESGENFAAKLQAALALEE
jgi:hypothetical protein